MCSIPTAKRAAWSEGSSVMGGGGVINGRLLIECRYIVLDDTAS